MFSFEIVHIQTKKIDYINRDKMTGSIVPMDGSSIFSLTTSILSLNAMGRKLWSIFVPEPSRRRIVRNKIFVKRDPFLFVYDLKTGKTRKFYRADFEYPPYQISVSNFMGKDYIIVGTVNLKGNKIIKWMDVFEARDHNLKRKFKFFSGIAPDDTLPSKQGIVIIGRAGHNYFIRNGYSDIYGGLFLLGLTGKIIASYRLYGKYVFPRYLYREGELLWISYSDFFEQERRSSGILIFDTVHWRAIKKKEFSSSFASSYHGISYTTKIGNDVFFPIILRTGEFLLLDKNLNIRARFRIQNTHPFLKFIDSKHDVRFNMSYLLLSGNKIYILYSIVQEYNDPRHGGTSRVFLKKFKVFTLSGKLLYERSFKPDYSTVVPVVDTKNHLISFLKGDKIEINRVL